MHERISLTSEPIHYRRQFDDYLGGGKIEVRGKTCYWSAHDSGYGFGWEIEPITEDEWNDITEDEFNEITAFIKNALANSEAYANFSFEIPATKLRNPIDRV